jgi:hypothetical protein
LQTGIQVPEQREAIKELTVHHVLSSRFQASLSISPTFTGVAGAIPLVASVKLPVCTTFVRYISSPIDRRFDSASNTLKAGTYLTSLLDRNHADTGFGSVGRYALPLPIPVSTVIEYTLPVGTHIEVGTVAPLFGQAGGGVEIKIVQDTVVHQGFTYPLPPY